MRKQVKVDTNRITLSVSTDDNSFESSVRFPVTATREQIDEIVKGWLNMMAGALAISVGNTEESGDGDK